MRQRNFTFKQFDVEAYFERRLKDHGREISVGITNADERRERIRYAILECVLECTIIGRKPDGRSETYGAAFERFYGEPLLPKSAKEKQSCSA